MTLTGLRNFPEFSEKLIILSNNLFLVSIKKTKKNNIFTTFTVFSMYIMRIFNILILFVLCRRKRLKVKLICYKLLSTEIDIQFLPSCCLVGRTELTISVTGHRASSIRPVLRILRTGAARRRTCPPVTAWHTPAGTTTTAGRAWRGTSRPAAWTARPRHAPPPIPPVGTPWWRYSAQTSGPTVPVLVPPETSGNCSSVSSIRGCFGSILV